MTDFVLSILNNISPNNFVKGVESIRAYAEFLKQPLTLGMFVPCDEDGNLWAYPPTNEEWEWAKKDSTEAEQSFKQKEYLFNKAKSRVLFEGFHIVDFEEHQVETLKQTSFLQWDDIEIASKKEWEDNWDFEYPTIESLSINNNVEITLTATAIKSIYGS